jgi:hypothetical protein
MFTSVLFFTFLSTFIAIVALGHAMLFAAIWPNLFASRFLARGTELGGDVQLEPASGAGRPIHLPN